MTLKSKKAFTLIELLVVIAIITLLISILLPALNLARAQGKGIVCRNNIHQLLLANIGYTVENTGYYVAAASDIYDYSADGQGGLHRWHGTRPNYTEEFDPRKGPLASYLVNGKIKKCPERVNFRKGDPWDFNFEDGCGGYGYNRTYIGSRIWQADTVENCAIAAKDTEVKNPAETIMFADSAMAKQGGGGSYYLEYSFVEPPYFVSHGVPVTSWGYASASLHFRHRKMANIGWADGHVTSHKISSFDVGNNVYGVHSWAMMLGWLDPVDNSFFDLK